MGWLSRRAMRTVERRFADQLEVGEAVLQFDVGKSKAGRVSLAVTDRAAIVMGAAHGQDLSMRVPFSSLSKVWTNNGGTLVSLISQSGTDLMFEFGRPRRPLVGDVLVESWQRWRDSS